MTGKSTTPSNGAARRVAFVWGGAGFVLGVVFWHVVGFWAFVSGIVFRDDGPKMANSEPPPPQPVPRNLSVTGTAPRMVTPPLDLCSSIVRDDAGGPAHSEPCPAEAEPLRLVAYTRRTDRSGPAATAPAQQPPTRAPAVADWSARVETGN